MPYKTKKPSKEYEERRETGLSPIYHPPREKPELYSHTDSLAGNESEDRVVLPRDLPEPRRNKRKGLRDKLTSIIAIVSLVMGIFFLSSRITGNTIADLNEKSSIFLGAVLLIIGLITGFFWIKNRRK